jgi:hypothetical protein
MARSLDWNKARERKLKGEAISADIQDRNARQDKYFKYKANVTYEKQLLEQGIWPTGKYKGKKLSELNENYLVWAGLNLKSKHTKYAANNELLRRYHSGEIKL